MLPTGRGKDLLLVQCTCMRHYVKDTLCLDQVGAGRAGRPRPLPAAGLVLRFAPLRFAPVSNANDLLTLRYVYPIVQPTTKELECT